ncbi:MAG: sugar phosphate isomerase/epimerase [Chloroflexi bacterium]|nr:sugar phosphate isomerase/epimerase [Chloroflexota bacterium]
MSNEKPLIVGASMGVEHVPLLRDWLFEKQRDLELYEFGQPAILDGDWRAHVEKAKAALDGFTGRLGIHGPDPASLAPWDPAVSAVVKRRYLQSLEACGALGATHMVIHSPFRFLGNHYLPNTPTLDHDDWIERAHRTIDAEVLDKAASINCVLQIENIWDPNPGLLLALVKSFDSDYVRMTVDIGHAFIAHQNGAPTPDWWIREAGEWLGHVHLQDTDGYADRHWPPGQGQVDWFPVFNELKKLRHHPRLILEIASAAHIDVTRWFAEQGYAQ